MFHLFTSQFWFSLHNYLPIRILLWEEKSNNHLRGGRKPSRFCNINVFTLIVLTSSIHFILVLFTPPHSFPSAGPPQLFELCAMISKLHTTTFFLRVYERIAEIPSSIRAHVRPDRTNDIAEFVLAWVASEDRFRIIIRSAKQTTGRSACGYSLHILGKVARLSGRSGGHVRKRVKRCQCPAQLVDSVQIHVGFSCWNEAGGNKEREISCMEKIIDWK